jgi:uncharacterized protein YgbK (DUF1537 family)
MVQLTEEQVRALKALARTRKMPVAKLVRESVVAYVTTAVKDPEQIKRKRRALAGLEKIKKAKYRDVEGKKDVSINHDKYLEEIYSS